MANMAKPNTTDARLVSSTWRRALVRRSTSGRSVRTSHQPHTSSTTTATTNSPVVVPLPQPQSAPFSPTSRAAQ
ncbi:hypothetical protein SAMN05216489_07481 [Streptomyces sp. 3213]|nr:hypothetical protein SAMN05216489_07481 [Streptomyces sp. 3213] [Streptomyces sp. 3213.3]